MEDKQRFVIVLIASIIMLWICMPLIWAFYSLGQMQSHALENPEWKQEIETYYKERGIDMDEEKDSKTTFNDLNDEDKKAWEDLTNKYLIKMDWLKILIIYSLILYVLIGFVGGYFSRSWIWVGCLPLLSCIFEKNPVLGNIYIDENQKVLIFAIQIVTCYLLAFWGASLAKKKLQKNN